MTNRNNLVSLSFSIVAIFALAACGSTVTGGNGNDANGGGGGSPDPTGTSSSSGNTGGSGGGGTGGSAGGGTGGSGGVFDFGPPQCDANIALDDPSPYNAAKVVEICKTANGAGDWGLTNAKWTVSDGSPIPVGFETQYALGHGNFDAFGPNVNTRKGDRMLGLSSGTARRPTDPGYEAPSFGYIKGYTHAPPNGFPKPSPACPGVTTGTPNDGVALEVTLRAPPVATGFSFDFNYYTVEFPEFTCTQFNDAFVALLSPTPAGQSDGNISFDAMGNIISVNNVFLDVCDCTGAPCGQVFACSLGPGGLFGTGFDAPSAGATGWLTTSAPVQGNAVFTLRFTVYDSTDSILDSATLVDNFRWNTQPNSAVGTIRAIE